MPGKVIKEAVQIGEIAARDVLYDLAMEATIAVDGEELAKIAQIPEVVDALGKVEAPYTKAYGTTPQSAGDWRAKVPEIRKRQWMQKPVIDHIAASNKEAVLEAVENAFAPMPAEWRAALFGPNRENMQYAKDPKALQLSMVTPQDIKTAKNLGKPLWPDNTNKWRFVYVQVAIKLGDAEAGTGFIGQIMKEARAAAASNKIVKVGEGEMQWASTLVGFDAALRNLDPYAGSKMSDTKVGVWDVADEPGYDIHVREGILDRVQDALTSALDTEVSGLNVSNDGIFTFSVSTIPAEEPSEQEKIAGEMEPEAGELDVTDTGETPEADFGDVGEAPEADLR